MTLVNAAGTVIARSTLASSLTDNTPDIGKTYVYAGPELYELGDDLPGTTTPIKTLAFSNGQTYTDAYVDSIYPVPPSADIEVSPATGSFFGAYTITITGSNFQGVTAVTVNAEALTSLVVSHDGTTITGTLPELTPTDGAVDVVITDDSGAITLTDAFLIIDDRPTAAPALSPTGGAAAGGTAVTITGTFLTGTTGVTFDAVAATSVVVVSATSVTCVSPAHAAGAVNVVIQHPKGNVTKTNAYTYS